MSGLSYVKLFVQPRGVTPTPCGGSPYQIGARYHGVRRRRFNTLPHYQPTIDEWTGTMQAPAAAGGFSAVQVPEPEFPAEVALALRAQDDPDG
eukprot:352354-Pyramimonas_sp.AAC.1